MIKRNRILSSIVLATIMLCTSGSFVHSIVQAQCPDSTGPAPNPDSICSWSTTFVYSQVPGTDCWDSVYYCVRNCNDSGQIWVYKVVPDPSSNCDSLVPAQLIAAAEQQAIDDAANFAWIFAPLCNHGDHSVVSVFIPSCWESQQKLSGTTFYNACVLDPPCYCQMRCEICVSGVAENGSEEISISNCTQTAFGICNCTTLAPVSGWEVGTCYYSPTCTFPPPVIESAGVGTSPDLDTSLRAYPNPVSGKLIVTSTEVGTHFQILDILGREVMTGIIANGPLSVDVSSLPSGTYYLSEGQKEVEFIKN